MVENREILDALVVELLERETLLKEDIERIFAKVKMVGPRPAWTGSSKRVPSAIPPVGLVSAKPQIDLEANPVKPARKPRKKAASAPKVANVVADIPAPTDSTQSDETSPTETPTEQA